MIPFPSPALALPWIAVGVASAAALWLALTARRRSIERDQASGALDRVADVAGLFFAQVDLEGRWQQVPGGLCELLGRQESELLGEPVVECLHPEDQDRCRSGCSELLSGERLPYALEARVVRPDGREIWVQMNGTQIGGSGKHPPFLQVMVRDISQAQAIAQSLKDSEEKFRTLSDNINCGVFLYTDVFHYINPGMEAITGYGPEDLLGQPIWKPVHPDEQ
jgi:PAS domain S-box-containing protein